MDGEVTGSVHFAGLLLFRKECAHTVLRCGRRSLSERLVPDWRSFVASGGRQNWGWGSTVGSVDNMGWLWLNNCYFRVGFLLKTLLGASAGMSQTFTVN